jgi:hypothetical protein
MPKSARQASGDRHPEKKLPNGHNPFTTKSLRSIRLTPPRKPEPNGSVLAHLAS